MNRWKETIVSKFILIAFDLSAASITIFNSLWKNESFKKLNKGHCDCGQVVIELAFYSDYPSSNPAEFYNLYSLNIARKEQKRGREWRIKKVK